MNNTTASLIVIGSELTRGIIADKHGQLVSRELTKLGYHMNEIIAIPDDGTIEAVLLSVIKHNDVIIITGGLGPTSDDMTRLTISHVAGKALVKNEEAYQRLYKRVGERIHGANEKQSYFPEDFKTILNPNGTAEGFYGKADNTLIICLPGPPREMEPMFREFVLPYLAHLNGHEEKPRFEYSTFLIAEAKLEELTKEVDSEINWGTRFQDYRISLYAEGDEKKVNSAIKRLQEKCGNELIVLGDKTALSSLTKTLREKGLTIAAAESCTGGLCSMLLTEEAGASVYFNGGVVSYAPSVKEGVLDVSSTTIKCYGTVSENCALEMAEGALKKTNSDYAFSVTGVAGPDKSEGKDVGTVCFGFAGKNRVSQAVTLHFTTWGRASVRRKSATAAFILANHFILSDKPLIDITCMWDYI